FRAKDRDDLMQDETKRVLALWQTDNGTIEGPLGRREGRLRSPKREPVPDLPFIRQGIGNPPRALVDHEPRTLGLKLFEDVFNGLCDPLVTALWGGDGGLRGALWKFMRWPSWIDELKDRYLADEANVFVLHGAVDGTLFDLGDETLDCVGVLKRFLSRTRPIVGVLRPWPHPSRIEFAGIMDRTHFENLVKAHEFVEGRTDALQETEPAEALARIWRALDTKGTDQAYLITESERVAPSHRRTLDAVPGAPDLLDWPQHAGLRASNNLIVLLVRRLDQLRSELLERAGTIHVAAMPPATTPDLPTTPDLSTTPHPLPDFDDLPDDPEPTIVPVLPPNLDDSLGEMPEPTIVPPTEPVVVDPESLHPELKRALSQTFLAYDAQGRAALLPVMDATAQALATHQPDRWGTLSFAVDEDGQPVITGTGADAFLSLWRSDITLDAAASMLTRELPESLAGGVPLDPTGLRVLAKRIAKLL
ncbi:MAG: hypothetical protein AAGA48_10950, partial [Myxococcota bacterium]